MSLEVSAGSGSNLVWGSPDPRRCCVFLCLFMTPPQLTSCLALFSSYKAFPILLFLCWFGGLNEKCPHGLRHLNTWSPVGDSVWEGSGGLAEKSLEESLYLTPFAVLCCCFVCVVEDLCYQLPTLTDMLAICPAVLSRWALTSWSHKLR